MKKLFLTLIGVAALALATVSTTTTACAQAPTFLPDVITLPLVQANMTSNLVLGSTTVLLDYSKQQNADMQFNCSWSVGAENLSNTNAVYTLAPTIDGTTFSTNITTTIQVNDGQATAGLIQRWATNLTNPYRGWIIIKIQNTHVTGILTNTVTRGTKISCP